MICPRTVRIIRNSIIRSNQSFRTGLHPVKLSFNPIVVISRVTQRSVATMRAQVLTAFNKSYEYQDDFAKPSAPVGKDILVKVQAASYCHTDAVFASGSMWQDLPRVGSHEFAGVIEALGPDVDGGLGLKEGMTVGVPGRCVVFAESPTIVIHVDDQ